MDSAFIEYRDSLIHGRGGFASTRIPTGTRIIEYAGQRIDKLSSRKRCLEGNHSIFYLDEEWDLDGSVDRNAARWLNHSCAPNSEAQLSQGRIWILASRMIEAGEEITFDYGYDLRNYRDHPCHCGRSNCVGFIVAEQLRDQLRVEERPLSKR